MSKNQVHSIHSRKANGVSILTTQKNPISRPKTSLNSQNQAKVPHRTYNRTISAQKADRRPPPEPIPSYINPKQKKENKKKQQQNQTLTMQSYLDDPECIQLREQIMDDSDLSNIENEQLEKLILHLKEYSADCASKRMYDDASISNAMIDYINKELSMRGNQPVIDRSLEESYENDREKTMQRHKEEQENLVQKFEEKRERLELKLKNEMDDFEADWKDEMPKKYRKASSKLLDLIDKEKRLAKAGKFDEAKLVKKQVDEQEQKEVDQAQRQMIKDYKIAKQKLEVKQNNEREMFEKNYIHNLECLHAQQKLDLDHLDNRMNVVNQRQEEAAKEAPKVIPQHKSSLGTTEGPTRERVLPPLIAPNDEEKLAEYRKREAEKRKKSRAATANKTRSNGGSSQRSPAQNKNDDDLSLFVTKSKAAPEEQDTSDTMKDIIIDGIENRPNKN